MNPKKVLANEVVHCRGHIVQFYNDTRYLTGAISEFVKMGLRREEAVVILCTQDHWKQLEQELTKSCDLFDSAFKAGQLLHFDAHDALSRVLDEKDRPDSKRFRALVGGVYASLRGKYTRVRFYGELVDILCSRGHTTDALILEGYWNDFLLGHHDTSLLCGYSTKNGLNEMDKEQV